MIKSHELIESDELGSIHYISSRRLNLGPVRKDEAGLLQWLSVDELLSPAVYALLFAQGEDDACAQVSP